MRPPSLLGMRTQSLYCHRHCSDVEASLVSQLVSLENASATTSAQAAAFSFSGGDDEATGGEVVTGRVVGDDGRGGGATITCPGG